MAERVETTGEGVGACVGLLNAVSGLEEDYVMFKKNDVAVVRTITMRVVPEVPDTLDIVEHTRQENKGAWVVRQSLRVLSSVVIRRCLAALPKRTTRRGQRARESSRSNGDVSLRNARAL